MSRSNNTELVNPAKYFFEWEGGKGCLSYYDKSKADKDKNIKGETVLVPLPFHFLVLDQLNSIKGYNQQQKSGYWSNEVRSTKTDRLDVRDKTGIVDSGLYSNLKILSKGAKYNKSVYIGYFEGEEMIIANLSIMASALGGWIDLCKNKNIYKYGISIVGAKQEKNGATEYFIPVYKLNPDLKPETEAKALELDKVLQEYLEVYLKRNIIKEELAPEDVITEQQKKDIKQFEPVKAVPVRDKGDYGYDDEQPVTQENAEDNDGNDLPF